MSKKVIFWTTAIDGLQRKIGNVGGIAVQMNFWSQEFVKNGWNSYSLSTVSSYVNNSIRFLYFPNIKYVRIVIEFILSFIYLLKIRPNLIITRGADRQISYLSLYTRILGIKYIHFSGSDADFEINGNKILSRKDNKLYVFGLRRLKYLVVQNSNQELLLRRNHFRGQQILIIPNIWPIKEVSCIKNKTIDFLWVGNFRDLKRPLWFIELAKKNPMYNFTMIGGISNKYLYEECKKQGNTLQNLVFLGPKDFEEVNEYFECAKCFVCTSEVEGFPNTFLQAWSNSIPVLTTFDPSERVTNYKLGKYVTDFDELDSGVSYILDEEYSDLQSAIVEYFKTNHNSEFRYKELMEFINRH